MERGHTHLLQSFFDRLSDHQTGIDRGSTRPTQLDREVDQISQAIQTHMIDKALNPALMLNFKSKFTDIPTIDLTGEKSTSTTLPLEVILLRTLKMTNASTAAPGHSIHQHGVWDESFSSVAPSHTGPAVAAAVPSTSGLQGIPTALLIINKMTFSPKSIDRVKALMSKENRAHTLITVGVEEAATHFDAPTSQDRESYDGDVSEVDEEDAEVIPDEEDNTQVKALKSAGMTCFQTMKAMKIPTRRMATKLQGLVTRNQFESVVTGHHLDLEMVQLVTTRTFLPQVERPNTPRTTFPFIASRELAECFS